MNLPRSPDIATFKLCKSLPAGNYLKFQNSSEFLFHSELSIHLIYPPRYSRNFLDSKRVADRVREERACLGRGCALSTR